MKECPDAPITRGGPNFPLMHGSGSASFLIRVAATVLRIDASWARPCSGSQEASSPQVGVC